MSNEIMQPLTFEDGEFCKNCGFAEWRHTQFGFNCHNYEPVTDMEQAKPKSQDKVTAKPPKHSCTAEIIAELERVLERYAEWYNKVSKEHGVKQEVPHTAFHQIIEEQIKELRGRS